MKLLSSAARTTKKILALLIYMQSSLPWWGWIIKTGSMSASIEFFVYGDGHEILHGGSVAFGSAFLPALIDMKRKGNAILSIFVTEIGVVQSWQNGSM
jgi:hypothetical protein